MFTLHSNCLHEFTEVITYCKYVVTALVGCGSDGTNKIYSNGWVTRERQRQQGGVLELSWKISDQSFDRSRRTKPIALQIMY